MTVEQKPRLLDLFAGAGGAARGYQRAGFYVVGVDHKSQPRYAGDEFVQGDALDVLRWLVGDEDDGNDVIGPELLELMSPGECRVRAVELVGGVVQHCSIEADHVGHCEPPVGVVSDSPKPASRVKSFDAIHASPPCQAYSALSWHPQNTGVERPDLIAPTRELLVATGLPYVIENVEHAPLRAPTRLCGSSFGLPLRRHRLFETNWPLFGPSCAHGQQRKRFMVHRHGKTILSRVVPVYGTGGGKAAEHWAAALEIDWMTRPEMAEAIPPAYTELIGHQLLQHIRGKAAA